LNIAAEPLLLGWIKPPRRRCRGGFAFSFVSEMLRTEIFSINNHPCGCFSLTYMRGQGIAESVFANRFAVFVEMIDARGRLTEGRSMDRDLGKPQKSQASTRIRAAQGHADRHEEGIVFHPIVPQPTPVQRFGWHSSSHGHSPAGLPMKQTTAWTKT
jgi:hypothetical protein